MSEELKQSLGSKVRAARKRAGLTQDELAGRIGKTPESISNIERGIQLPMLDTLDALGRALEVPLGEFFEQDQRPEKAPTRVAAEARMRELVRGLDDDMLTLALGQVEVLATTPRRR